MFSLRSLAISLGGCALPHLAPSYGDTFTEMCIFFAVGSLPFWGLLPFCEPWESLQVFRRILWGKQSFSLSRGGDQRPARSKGSVLLESTHVCFQFLPPQNVNPVALAAFSEGSLVSACVWSLSTVRRAHLWDGPEYGCLGPQEGQIPWGSPAPSPQRDGCVAFTKLL